MNALDWFVGGIVRVWHGLYTQVAIPTPYLAGHTMRQSEVFALAVVGTCAAIAMVTVGRLYRAEECKSESRSQPWSATAATLVFGGLSLGLACFTTWNVLWFGGLRRGPVEFHGIIYYSQNDYVNALLWLVVRHFLLAVGSACWCSSAGGCGSARSTVGPQCNGGPRSWRTSQGLRSSPASPSPCPHSDGRSSSSGRPGHPGRPLCVL